MKALFWTNRVGVALETSSVFFYVQLHLLPFFNCLY